MTRRKLLLAAPALFFLMAFSCSKYHTAVVVEHDFVTAVTAFQQGETALYQNGTVSQAEHVAIETKIAAVASAGQQLNSLLAANATPQAITTQIQLVVAAVSDLNTNGVLQIKNPSSQATLSTALKVISDIVANISATI